jgi:hypothetical protein
MRMTDWFTAGPSRKPKLSRLRFTLALAACQLGLHPDKTRIVYCKDVKRNAEYPIVMFDFLGYCFRPRLVKNPRTKQLF